MIPIRYSSPELAHAELALEELALDASFEASQSVQGKV